MYAVSENPAVGTKVWFGGSYTEHWTENYTLSVSYEGRRFVSAQRQGGIWRPCGGDEQLCRQLSSPDCDRLLADYFQAAASVYTAARECLGRGLGLQRLWELAYFESSLAGPELLRLMMDDCGFGMEEAYQIAARCCADMRIAAVDIAALAAFQPRTASVAGLLRELAGRLPAALHDSRRECFRTPFGAVQAGEELRLAFRLAGGRADSAALILYGDELYEQHLMQRQGDVFSLSFPAPEKPAALWYRFRIDTAEGSFWLCPDESGYIGMLSRQEAEGFRLTVYQPGFDTPHWFRRSVMYQIFPDRFAFSGDGTAERGIAYHRALGRTAELHSSLDEPVRYMPRSFEKDYMPDDFYGGTLRGIEEKLPYLSELGVNCLYLNPIAEARSNHRYDTADYMRVDPVLGTNEDFSRLCLRAEEQGIRIILDGVFSHTGADSRYFNRYGRYAVQGACQGRESEYYSWYDFTAFPDKYRCWWGFEELPEVDELEPSWQSYVFGGSDSVVKTWLRRGAAGWRLDVADELPDRVLELIRQSAREEKADALILGEVWEDAVIKESYGSRRGYALGTALDSVMNYPLREAVLDFAKGRRDACALRDFLTLQQMNYPRPMYYALMNLLGSHDVERLRTALCSDAELKSLSREQQQCLEYTPESLRRGARLERLCAVLQFSLPGVPCIYYGQEQGMLGARDPFNRLPFEEQDGELRDFYAELAKKRRGSAALSTGFARFMAPSADVLLVLRYTAAGRDAFGESAGDEAWLAVINRGDRACVEADCSAAGAGALTLDVPAMSGRLIRVGQEK